jgi:hypothetical protein
MAARAIRFRFRDHHRWRSLVIRLHVSDDSLEALRLMASKRGIATQPLVAHVTSKEGSRSYIDLDQSKFFLVWHIVNSCEGISKTVRIISSSLMEASFWWMVTLAWLDLQYYRGSVANERTTTLWRQIRSIGYQQKPNHCHIYLW